VLATILRAGLPLHYGLLNFFDKADNAFIAAYRKHRKDGSFEISSIIFPARKSKIASSLSQIQCWHRIITGKTIQFLKEEGKPKEIHIVTAIACTVGIEYVKRKNPL
jgi:uracil phosphoribosyltransferase